MAFKRVSLASAWALLLSFPLLIESHSHLTSQSFNNLQGCSKGQTFKGLHKAKHYLNKFGYLPNYQFTSTHNNANKSNDDDDYFDDELELAVKTYQVYFHLNVTGALDAETLQQMSVPRCGVPDIVNGKSGILLSGKGRQLGSTQLHIVSRYAFLPGAPKWPPTKTHLKYGFIPGAIGNMDIKSVSRIVSAAFPRWEHVSHFTFEETQDLNSADLRVGFFRRDHGDGAPFDGPFGTTAHSFEPTIGDLHFDADETWGDDLAKDHIDLESVAIHEIGHLLGLGHTTVPGAIMFPTLNYGVRKVELQPDDIQGIQALYS